jgi:hypothetical protein
MLRKSKVTKKEKNANETYVRCHLSSENRPQIVRFIPS